jgi:hypothetical protein
MAVNVRPRGQAGFIADPDAQSDLGGDATRNFRCVTFLFIQPPAVRYREERPYRGAPDRVRVSTSYLRRITAVQSGEVDLTPLRCGRMTRYSRIAGVHGTGFG